MAGKPVIVKAENIVKHYAMGEVTVRALRGVSLSIKAGAFMAIMGPSGSGKSTMMHLIGCLDTPTSGSIFIDNHDVSRLKEKELAEIRNKKIGFVFQQFNLLADLSVLENIMTPLLYAGVPLKQRQLMAEKMLDRVGLSDRLLHRPNELSGGQKQRVAIARALINEPKIILADEPTGNLDTQTGASVLSLFKEINTGNTTVIIVTHDERIALEVDECIRIQDGVIQ